MAKPTDTKKPQLRGLVANSLTFGISAVKLYLPRYRLYFTINLYIPVKCSISQLVKRPFSLTAYMFEDSPPYLHIGYKLAKVDFQCLTDFATTPDCFDSHQAVKDGSMYVLRLGYAPRFINTANTIK